MNVTAWLDVAIGLVVVYLGASLFVTILNELVGQWLNLRGKALFASIGKLVTDPAVRTKLATYPVLAPFFGAASPKEAPSYVDPVAFARALLAATATPGGAGAADPTPSLELQKLVGAFGGKGEALVTKVASWVDRSLDVLADGYKRSIRWVSLLVALVVAVALNLDTVGLVSHLYKDKESRDAAVAVALDVTGRTDKATFDKCMQKGDAERKQDETCTALNGLVDAVRHRNASLAMLPIGWGSVKMDKDDAQVWIFRIVGWLLTTLGLSLGAPFWFDVLTKFVNVRGAIARPKLQSEGKAEAAANP